MSIAEIPSQHLRRRCDPHTLGFSSTAEVTPADGVVGQDMAIEALNFGLETNAPGQNIFVRGLTGTGRMTLVRRLLEKRQPTCPLVQDRCYVRNFAHPDRPRLVSLPPGAAPMFKNAIEDLIEFVSKDLPKILATEHVVERRKTLENPVRERIEGLTKAFDGRLQQEGLTLVTVMVGQTPQMVITPMIDGQPAPPERLAALLAEGTISKAQLEDLQGRAERYLEDFEELTHELHGIQRDLRTRVREMHEKELRATLSVATRSISQSYPFDPVNAFLGELVDDIVYRVISPRDSEPETARRYGVKVVLTHALDSPCPIIIENAPSVLNLLGTIDKEFHPDLGGYSDHTMIRAGALMRADGGYLILEARDVLTEPGAWRVLVRTLKTGQLEITRDEMQGFWAAPSLKPEPVPINVKVILLGDQSTYGLLDTLDPDFPHHFKVLADFDSTMPYDEAGVRLYAGVLAKIAREEDLPAFAAGAVAALAEHGARISGHSTRLTTRFGRLADIAREAAFLAQKRQCPAVDAEDVQAAVLRGKQRADLPARRYRELIADGIILIQMQGSVVGQVNGLAVLQAGPLTYGFPMRITATIGPGTAGTINIEREAQLSGSIHTKGFYILGGLLRHLLRTSHPLAFSASVAFEQSYGGIDGDSASAAEACCLLSALTEIPIRQDLAMTGAIDQFGAIQPVGAINEKIEGFYDTCVASSLMGTQGVVIPVGNVRDLMLRDDVVKSCAEQTFRIFAVESIHQALELMTGQPAGERGPDGSYPDESLLGQATDQAREYWELAMGVSDDDESDEDPDSDEEPTS